jgi:hypothetical protein
MASLLAVPAGTTIAQVPTPMPLQPMAEAMGAMEVQTCWYDAQGNLTGATPAPAGAKPGSKVQADSSGAHAWSYTVKGHDASVCPSRLPISTMN